MPLKNGYDFENFQSGWSKFNRHRHAVDPRNLNVWTLNVWAVLPLKFDGPEPPEKTRDGLARLDRFAGAISANIYRHTIYKADRLLSHVLGGPFDTAEETLRRAIARLYEASDSVAMQQERERNLIYKGGEVAERILKAQECGRSRTKPYRKNLRLAGKILGELRCESRAESLARRRKLHTCRNAVSATVENLIGIRENFIPRGPLADRAKVFFVWRLAELYFLITRQHPIFTFSTCETAEVANPIRHPFHQFLLAAFEITGLNYTQGSLDHYLRMIGQGDYYQRSMLDFWMFGDGDRFRPFSSTLTLPSTGILLDYYCREFYDRKIYPPSLRHLSERPEDRHV